ncbi:hypothetical protein LEP1GSC187_0692 [Leptospira santarosai str. ZUN179]|uniref:Uncharacterized protein n=1 Tax=Leptospira santarosai str. ZUN179 TaxID=1049985 RepID=M6UTS3_9LEPT|nr:hypothetical protein LEP1GSC187_0692 [Leptospira santarosai str. ZUN179]
MFILNRRNARNTKGLFVFVGNVNWMENRLNSYRNVRCYDLKINFPRRNFRNLK